MGTKNIINNRKFSNGDKIQSKYIGIDQDLKTSTVGGRAVSSSEAAIRDSGSIVTSPKCMSGEDIGMETFWGTWVQRCAIKEFDIRTFCC